MLRLIWRLVRLAIVLLVLGVGFYFFHGVLLAPVGRFLVTADPLEKSDLILVLAGAPYLTASEAARRYHEGWAPLILLTNQPRPRGQEELIRLGVPVHDDQAIAQSLLSALRVPPEAARALPDRSDGTIEELQAVRRFLAVHSARSLILVTPKAQSTRARRICLAELGPDVGCGSRPAAGDPFDPGRWWSYRRDVAEVVYEYAALAYDLGRMWWSNLAGRSAVPPPVTIR
jgi:uncharacterized SAM-binding protein YcdF (DUF218 family)